VFWWFVRIVFDFKLKRWCSLSIIYTTHELLVVMTNKYITNLSARLISSTHTHTHTSTYVRHHHRPTYLKKKCESQKKNVCVCMYVCDEKRKQKTNSSTLLYIIMKKIFIYNHTLVARRVDTTENPFFL